MKQLKIIGLDFQSAVEHTKKCLSDTLSPVKKDAVVRSFLKRFLSADNEHTLPNHFISEEKEQQYVICYSELDDYSKKIASQTFSITTSSNLEDDLKVAFKAHFYSEQYIIDNILNSDLIEDFISNNNLDENIINSQIRQMNSDTLSNWLINNFEINQLIDDNFYCEVLNSGFSKLAVYLTFPPENRLMTSYSIDADN